MTVPLPKDQLLGDIARSVAQAGLVAMLADADWRIVWVSEEWEALFGVGLDDDLIGTNYVEFVFKAPIREVVTERSFMRAGLDLLAAMLVDVPGGKPVLAEWVEAEMGDGASAVLEGLEPNPSAVWDSALQFIPSPGMRPAPASWVGIRLYDQGGKPAGHLHIFSGTSVPFRYVPMLARGDPAALGRLASLTRAARHDVVVLSADLQDSAVLARRLSTAAFFELIAGTTSASDHRIVERGGIVGRHAGDGVMAFFLAEHLGDASAAARAAVEVATSLGAVVDQAVSGTLDAHVPVNVALHWGNVFMGQLVSEGRLEVTALGDAVNECARIAECSRDGAVLASKGVIEQLNAKDAAALGIDSAKIAYERLEDLPSAGPKARRDAGGLAVARLA